MSLSFKERVKSLFLNDFFVTFLILCAYLFTNTYVYGWDDQHLEIPLLKHLIDPALYQGDYYVESLTKNFSSFLYPLLAKLIKVNQIPSVYWILFLISRYTMFFFFYKLCQLISKDKFAALCAVLMFFLTGRTEDFLYRTFSHQELGLAFMFAGIYFFYKDRFLLAALILGLGANVHAIYNLFPMCFMLVFLLLFHAQRFQMTLKAGLIFILGCLPFLMWHIPRSLHDKLSGAASVPISDWMPLYFRSCPQNFLFFDTPVHEALQKTVFLCQQIEPYVFLMLLYVLLLIVHPPLRKDTKTHVIVGVAWILIILSVIFAYIIPNRFILDLNLLRNEQYLRVILMAYTAFWAVKTAKEGKSWQAFLAATVFLFIGFGHIFLFKAKFLQNVLYFGLMVLTFIILYMNRWPRLDPHLRKLLILLPLLAGFIAFTKMHYIYIEVKEHGAGLWQFHRSWIDMQLYVKEHTPKKAFVLAPIDTQLGGFRIQSERKIVVCIRDCGIVGFDYKASQEWSRRMEDMKDFVYMTNRPVDQAVLLAILKYKVDYVVFMKYYEPASDNGVLKKIYENEVFSLFKVTRSLL